MSITKTLLALSTMFAMTFVSCSDKTETTEPIASFESVQGIEKEYTQQLNETFTLTPTLIFTEGVKPTATYEWNINYKVVGREATLNYVCDTPGLLNGYLKVSVNGNTEIKEFKLYVLNSFDKGLLLLSQTNEGSELSFKDLNNIDTPPAHNVFAVNNPSVYLGKTPLALCWSGEGITNPQNINDWSNGLEVIVSSDNPQRTFILDSGTLKVKTEVSYKGEGNFQPNYIFVPYGSQNFMWDAAGDVICFVGSGREYLLTHNREFSLGRRKHEIPQGTLLANMACSLNTTPQDMLKVYFDNASKRMIYVSGLSETRVGNTTCKGEALTLLACKGVYASPQNDARYEPQQALLVTKEGQNTYLYRFVPANKHGNEQLVTQVTTTNHILSTSAIGVNPVKPFVYYSDDKGNIYVYNFESNNFSTEPYLSLGRQYVIQQIVFNPYNENEMYVAAENKTAPKDVCATLFICNVQNKERGAVTRIDEKAGGSVVKLIYKGNGTENSRQLNRQ